MWLTKQLLQKAWKSHLTLGAGKSAASEADDGCLHMRVACRAVTSCCKCLACILPGCIAVTYSGSGCHSLRMLSRYYFWCVMPCRT